MVSLPIHGNARKSKPTDLKKVLMGPKFGEYRNCQISATDTDERIVGKKYKVLSAREALVFLTR